MPIELPIDETQKMIAFVDRRHPAFMRFQPHWQFCESTYEGGREWFSSNIHAYLKEGTREYADRLNRAYRFNHTKEVVSLVTKYIFKEGVIRNLKDAPASLVDFWDHATLDGANIDSLMRQVSVLSSIAGRVWIAVDSMQPDGVISIADSKLSRSKIYAYLIRQQDVLDFARDDMGELNWILYRLSYRDDSDPITSSGHVMNRYMLWTKEEWILLEERIKNSKGGIITPSVTMVVDPANSGIYNQALVNGIATIQSQYMNKDSDQREIVLIDRQDNKLGEIPIIPIDHMENTDPYAPPGLIDDISYLDRAVANYLSNLDAIIQDQTFSQLTMPAQGLMPGEDAYNKMLEMGTKRIFIYDGESGKEPNYITPDASNAELIVSVIRTIINEIYHSVGLAGERTKQDNAMGIDNSSGVAKAYDFDRMDALLRSKALMLDKGEQRVAHFVMRYAGVKESKFINSNGKTSDPSNDDVDAYIKYPESFDTRGLPDEFDIADNLSLLQAPESLRRYQMNMLTEKLFPRLQKDIKLQIEKDLIDWPADPVEQAAEMITLKAKLGGGVGGSIQSAPSAPTKTGMSGPKSLGSSKQGQNPGKSKGK